MFSRLIAQTSANLTTSKLEWDWPLLWKDWIPLLLLFAAVLVSLFVLWRDTRRQRRIWSLVLGVLRIGFLVVAVLIALNPHERTQHDALRDSRVILLVDTSQSMQQPEADPRSTGGQSARTRMDAVEEVLKTSPLVAQLRERHTLEVYTFDSDISEMRVRLPRVTMEGQPGNDATTDGGTSDDETGEGPSDDDAATDWAKLLEPTGLLTRLGDSLDTLLAESKSPTLSGIIVISDGASNAGRDILAPRSRAQEQGARLVTVGVGSTEPPVNLQLARIIAPTDVQKGDNFDVSTTLTGQGLEGRTVTVELLDRGPTDSDASVIQSEQLRLNDDGQPNEVVFSIRPTAPGDHEITMRARLEGATETRADDNQASRTVNIFDRPLRVLVIAGGPMRDYRYARTVLHRHPSMEVDVWLQSGKVGISQDANQLLFRFPEKVEDLYAYDAVLAFDVNWTVLEPAQFEMLTNWISNEGGGLVVVAGDVFTPQVASQEQLEPLRKLLPVLLEEMRVWLRRDTVQTAFPLAFTQEGQAAEFLKLAEGEEETAWSQFEGIFRTYPTQGAKAGATVYAEFSDPLSRGAGGQPIVLASQRYGQGQVVYLGSPEIWRLREVDAAFLERFWIKAVRKASEGRSKRGLQRSQFIMDGREYMLGQPIPVRLRALNAQFQPLAADVVTLDVTGPGGVPVVPSPELRRDPIRPAEYVGDFRPLAAGRFRLAFAVPDANEKATLDLDVQMPRQEAASLVQNEELLERLADGTGGTYVPLAKAATMVPDLLPDKSEQIVIDQQIRELWDQNWMLYLLAALLSLEWLTRKLLKLA